MSEIITVPQERTPDTVAVEIRTLQKAAQKMAVSYAIEIGRKLVEAKDMVSHGEWGTWLEEEVSYSKSTANNLMKLYREYGSDQIDMFADPAKRQALEELSYTQALLLLAVPAEERAEFADVNDVANKSTRELEALIKERDEAMAAKQEAEEDRTAAMELKDAAINAQVELQKEMLQIGEKMEKAVNDAEMLKDQANQAEEKLRKAKQALEEAKQKLKELQENPVVPEDTMARIRAEAEQEAQKKAMADLEKKMQEAEAKAQKAQDAAHEAEQARQEAEKKLSMADKDMVAFQLGFQQVQEDWNRMTGLLMKIKASNPETASKLTAACNAVLEQWKELLRDGH